jgi:hypothetical protein
LEIYAAFPTLMSAKMCEKIRRSTLRRILLGSQRKLSITKKLQQKNMKKERKQKFLAM